MTQAEQLQKCVDFVAQSVPALAGAKVKTFGQIFEVWTSPQSAAVVGSHGTVMLWLGCVALTGRVYPYPQYEPFIVQAVVHSAERAGVI